MSKSKEPSRSKVQPTLENPEPFIPERTSEKSDSRGGSPDEKPRSKKSSSSKRSSSRQQGGFLSPSGISVVNIPGSTSGKSTDSSRRATENTARQTPRKPPGVSILKKSRFANPNEAVAKTEGSEQVQEKAKRMKITFRENLEHVHIIENWKDYNSHDYAGNVTCYCNVF